MKNTLQEILEVQKRHAGSPRTFPGVIGDGYLYDNNQIFRNIRNTVLELGYTFEENPSSPYYTFPLISLKDLLETKTIPYRNNLYWIEKIDRLRAGTFSLGDLTLGPEATHLCHESAHCIADFILKEGHTSSAIPKNFKDKGELLKILLAESYANTAESMVANLLPQNKQNHWFLEQNLYMRLTDPSVGRLRRRLGLKGLTELTLLLFLYANFMFVQINPVMEKRILKFLGIDPALLKDKKFHSDLRSLEKNIAFTLNPQFIVVTTSFYLKMLGYRAAFSKMLNFDPVIELSKDTGWRKKIALLGQVIDGTFSSNFRRTAVTEAA